MNVYTKDAAAEIKAVGGSGEDELSEHQFKALISVFNTVDSYGDCVMPGAFTETLAEWNEKGDPIPIIWSHMWSDLWAHIGYVPLGKATETESGLVVVGDLDPDNPTAMQAHKLMKQRRITQFSFGFDILEAGWGERETEGGERREVYELKKLRLHEVGPCLVGVNRETELLAVKGKSPRQLASEGLRNPSGTGSAIPRSKAASDLALLNIYGMTEIEK